MVKIIPLKEVPDYAPILALWAYREWYINRQLDFDLLIRAYKDRIDDSKMPMALVAIQDKIPVGMVSLKENDVRASMDLNPWLSSLYVLPEYRNHGIGQLLIEKVRVKTAELNLNRLYLFTDANSQFLNNYYSKKGWVLLKDGKGNDANLIKIYYYNISS
jgi:GNAT superfamily N-acetyltransferase